MLRNGSVMPRVKLDVDAPYLANAYHLSRMALAVYSDDPEEDFPELRASFDRILSVHRERIYGLVMGNASHVVVTFRGRDDNRQLVESLRYGQTEWVRGRAHGGFVRSLDSIWRAILAAFFDVGAHEKTLWVAGHSMGGSLGVLAAQRLAFEGFDPHLVVTFGAPRVLDPVAARAFPTRVFRFVNNEDAIPNFVWPTLFDTYAHVGKEVFLLASGDVAQARHTARLARKIDRAQHIGEGILPAGPVHDHGMEEYVSKLARYA